MEVFKKENLTSLQDVSVKITNLCAQNINGKLMFSKLTFLGSLIKDFAENPIVKTSEIIEIKK